MKRLTGSVAVLILASMVTACGAGPSNGAVGVTGLDGNWMVQGETCGNQTPQQQYGTPGTIVVPFDVGIGGINISSIVISGTGIIYRGPDQGGYREEYTGQINQNNDHVTLRVTEHRYVATSGPSAGQAAQTQSIQNSQPRDYRIVINGNRLDFVLAEPVNYNNNSNFGSFGQQQNYNQYGNAQQQNPCGTANQAFNLTFTR